MKDKKLNVLHWPTAYPDPDRGEPFHNIFIQEHIKSLQPYCNNRVLYIAAGQPDNGKLYQRKDSVENDVKVTRMYFNRKVNLRFLNYYIRAVIFLFFLELIYKEKFRPSLIHVHFFPSGLWARLFSKIFSIPMITTEHWTALIGYPVVSKARFNEAKQVYDYSKFVLPVSEHLKNGIEKNTGTHLNGKARVILNSVDTELFTYKGYAIPDSPKKLVCVARVDEQKDMPNLLRTVALVNKQTAAEVTIIGGGDSAPLMEMAKELGIADKVHFTGAQSKAFIADTMQHSHLFVLSSIAENSPCVIGEALCTGLPVVATDVGGVTELVNEYNALIVPARNSEALAEAVLKMLARPVDKERIAKEAVSKFCYDNIGREIYEVYQQAV